MSNPTALNQIHPTNPNLEAVVDSISPTGYVWRAKEVKTPYEKICDPLHWDATHAQYYEDQYNDGKSITVISDNPDAHDPVRKLSRNVAIYGGRYATGADRDANATKIKNSVILQENAGPNGVYFIYDDVSDTWINTGSDVFPVIQPDFTETISNQKDLSNVWQALETPNYIRASDWGVAVENQDNQQALQDALAEAKRTGLPLMIRPSQIGYRVVGDLNIGDGHNGLLSYGPGALLDIVDGGLMFDGRITSSGVQEGNIMANIGVRRIGTAPGPAVKITAAVNANTISWMFYNFHINESTGNGLQLEGTFLGAIYGLWIGDCVGNGVHIEPGTFPDSHSLGANSIAVYGGEIRNCAWGMVANDTKSIVLDTVAIEGNRDGGVWLQEDNRSTTLKTIYTENNAKDHPFNPANLEEEDAFCDFRIGIPVEFEADGVTPKPVLPNMSVVIDNPRCSDGTVPNRRAIWIEEGQHKIAIRSPLFRAFGGPPVKLVGDSNSTTTGYIDGANRVDGDGNVNQFLLANNAKPRNFIRKDQQDVFYSDFETDNFAPEVSFVTPGDLSVNYILQEGRFTRSGGIVTFWINLSFILTHTTAVGQLVITGLPYPSNGFDYPINVTTMGRINPPANTVGAGGFVLNEIIQLEFMRDDATAIRWTANHFGTAITVIRIAGSYQV